MKHEAADKKEIKIHSPAFALATALSITLMLMPTIASAAANDLVFNASNLGVIDFNTASQLKLRLTNDGNVGIGTATPANMLNVIGDANIYQGALTQYPPTPKVISSIDNDTNLNDLYSVFVSGKYAYTANNDSTSGNSNFTIIDISNPYNPQITGILKNDTNLYLSKAVYVSGKYAYVTNNSRTEGKANFAIIDISNPYSPQVISSIDNDTNLGLARSIYVSGKYAYIVDYNNLAGYSNFAIVDISNPYSPQVISSIDNDTNLNLPMSIYVSGKYAYVANYNSTAGQSNFAVIDVSNPYSPQVISSIDNDTNLYTAVSIYISGKYAYVANAGSTEGKSNFAIIDLGASDLQSINTGSIQTGGLQVTESAIVNGVLTANQSITAGLGGIYSQGPLSVVDSNSSVLTSIFTVGKDANVGIGTTTATNKLTIIGDLNAVTSAGTTALYTNASSDGNVGIGTTNPLAKLHIRYADEIGGSYAFRVDNDTATGPRSAFNLTYYKDGNLGINLLNTLPYNGYVLDVNGGLNIRGSLLVGGNAYSTGASYAMGRNATADPLLHIGGALSGESGTAYKILVSTGNNGLSANNSAANLFVSGYRFGETSSGIHPIIATAAILQPRTTAAGAAVGDTAALYIEDENKDTGVSGGNWALWVDAGKSRFDGNVLIGSDLATPIGALDVNAPNANNWTGARFLVAFDGNVGVWLNPYSNEGAGIYAAMPTSALDVNGEMKLQPTDSPGQCAATDTGSIYYDNSISELCTCNGTNWVKGSDNTTVCT